jgi:predicted transposase YbfD/YdcC
MPEKPSTIIEHFSTLTDPRVRLKTKHKLIDIIVITVCGTICGADNWAEIEIYGNLKQEWLEEFLELPNGIPSHDTFGRVFSLISPEEFQRCFLNWVQSVFTVTDGQVVAIDGKTLRHSYDRANNKSAIHMVSAWASKNGLTLGQVKTDAKSNEITAIPELLRLLEIKGCIVTIDAMGCQKKIAEEIVDRGGDYVLALKGNQGTLMEDVEFFFLDGKENKFKDIDVDYHETVDGGHGRVEIRRHWTVSDIDWLHQKGDWNGLKTIGMVESERHIDEEISIEQRFYIASISNDAKMLAKAVREHWGIENRVHWVLDVAFDEDGSRIRKGNASENLAVIRHITLNLLRNEKTKKVGIKAKRKAAGWDNPYMLKVLGVN